MLLPLALYASFGLVAWEAGYLYEEHPGQLDLPGREGVPWFGVAFIGLYAAMATFAMPLAPLAYAAGGVFGMWRAAAMIWIASVIGAAAGYYLAHGMWASAARQLLGRHEAVLRRIGQANPALTAFRLQLLPIIPFGLFNYAAAISGMPIRQFLIGTALGIIPGTIAAAVIGDRVLEGVAHGDRAALRVAAYVAVGLLVLTFLPSVVKWFRGR